MRAATWDGVWWAVRYNSEFCLRSDDILESKMRTWATVPPVLTKHSPPFSAASDLVFKFRSYLVQATAQDS